jgi:branched-chain amino acid transport system ATP-binding protein
MAALKIEALSAGYGALRVLDGIDLELDHNERVGLVGLNGHGKTTLLRAIVGLVGWRRGEITHRGHSLMHDKTYSITQRGVVLVPQGDALFPGMTVRENLDAGALAGRSWRERTSRREYVIELFPKLGERLRQSAGTLSGGERRMLSLGRGLMSDADVYLVDEPSLGLAPGVAKTLLRALGEIDLRGGAMLIAEQNRALLEERVQRVVRIHHGRASSDLGQDDALLARVADLERAASAN